MLKKELIKAISAASGISKNKIILTTPPHPEHGDFSTNVAISNKLNPEDIKEKLSQDKLLSKYISKIEIKNGFINLFLSQEYLLKKLNHILEFKNTFGNSDINKGQKFMVEFAHPNTHKAFHIGHLRNITTGESISRILTSTGANIVRANYQGDVGLHIAKAIWGALNSNFVDPKTTKERAELLSKVYVLGNKAYEEDGDAKSDIISINKKLYSQEDKRINQIYSQTRAWSLDYFDSIYKRVYVKFDRLYFESQVAQKGKKLAFEAAKKGILEKSEGAIVFKGEKIGLHTRVFITKEDTPTYEAKDLGLAELQFSEYKPDSILHIVGPEQSEYFKVIFKVLEKIVPESTGKEFHIPYGWVKLKDGKMSSRTGNVVLGDWLLDEVKNKLSSKFDTSGDTLEQIAIAAVKYSFLKNGLSTQIAFDIDESISTEGNSGPYLQYTFARTQSVISKSNLKIENSNTENLLKIKNLKLNIDELSLLRHFTQFQGIIIDAANFYSPNLLCEYLYTLAQSYNTFYNKHKIILPETKDKQYNNLAIQQFRLSLTAATGTILHNGLKLLGIDTPSRL